jgi:hypothetical protein
VRRLALILCLVGSSGCEPTAPDEGSDDDDATEPEPAAELLAPACPTAPPSGRVVVIDRTAGMRVLASDAPEGPWDDLGLELNTDALVTVQTNFVIGITRGAEEVFYTVDAHGQELAPPRFLPPGVSMVDIDVVEGRTAASDGLGDAVIVNCTGPGQEGLPTAELQDLGDDLVGAAFTPEGLVAAMRSDDDGPGQLVRLNCDADVLGVEEVDGAPTLLHGPDPAGVMRVLSEGVDGSELGQLDPLGEVDGPWHPLPTGTVSAWAAAEDGTAWIALEDQGTTSLLCADPGSAPEVVLRWGGAIEGMSSASDRLAVITESALGVFDVSSGCGCAPDPSRLVDLDGPRTLVGLPGAAQ